MITTDTPNSLERIMRHQDLHRLTSDLRAIAASVSSGKNTMVALDDLENADVQSAVADVLFEGESGDRDQMLDRLRQMVIPHRSLQEFYPRAVSLRELQRNSHNTLHTLRAQNPLDRRACNAYRRVIRNALRHATASAQREQERNLNALAVAIHRQIGGDRSLEQITAQLGRLQITRSFRAGSITAVLSLPMRTPRTSVPLVAEASRERTDRIVFRDTVELSDSRERVRMRAETPHTVLHRPGTGRLDGDPEDLPASVSWGRARALPSTPRSVLRRPPAHGL